MERLQVNVRLTPELISAIDQKRIALQPSLGRIPSRSEVIREILESTLIQSGQGAQCGDSTNL
ncbi:conserved protein of unknown function [Denitratisoma oestradiolicum]|uniref:Uncharacterized protein n=1 Tax=Denitratisoma oestradiolicum TaxID=311182 RepID=A0A6S6XUY2_9PROT|nr:conserved protein of unknown function [Denitratisoma oestradiolicum]